MPTTPDTPAYPVGVETGLTKEEKTAMEFMKSMLSTRVAKPRNDPEVKKMAECAWRCAKIFWENSPSE